MKVGDEVFLIKYALSNGVEKHTVHKVYENGAVNLSPNSSPNSSWMHYFASEIAETELEAIRKVREMGDARIRSLARSRAKLEKLDKHLGRGELPMAKERS